LNVVSIEDIAEKVDYGLTEKAKDEEVGPKFLRITDIQDDRVNWDTVPYCECDEKEFEKNKLEEGDIVFARTGATTGKSFLVKQLNQKAVYASYLIRLRLDANQVMSEFVSYFFKSQKYWNQIYADSDGATLPSFNATKLKALNLPLPTIDEQKAIVAKLDRAQRLIDIDKEMLAKYDELIQSLFLEMFGDPVTNPKGWEIKKLGDLTTKVGSGSTPRGGSKVYQDYGNIFIRSQNVLMNKLDLEDVAYISDEIHEGMKNTWVEEYDVLLNITGASIGRICVYNQSESANVNQHVCILRPIQEQITPYYLSYLISSKNYQDKIIGQQTGGTRQAFNMTQIKNFDIPLPPLEKQQKFQQLLSRLIEEIETAKGLAKKSEELFSSLVQGTFSHQ
jgi:type I restriction enzyme S subunit